MHHRTWPAFQPNMFKRVWENWAVCLLVPTLVPTVDWMCRQGELESNPCGHVVHHVVVVTCGSLVLHFLCHST